MTAKTKKTTTRKRAVKATSKKKVSTKKRSHTKKVSNKKKLICATGTNCFWVNNGPILRDLVELERALDTMTEKIFSHHVSGSRNDFADWVEHVLKDQETAAALRRSKKPKTARTVVVRQLKLYTLPNTK